MRDFSSFSCMFFCIHTLFLMEVEEEVVDLSDACGFSSSFHTRWSESDGPKSPMTFCQRRSSMTAAWHELVHIHCRPRTTLKQTQACHAVTDTESAFCCEAGDRHELFVWTLVQTLCFETELWAKRLSSLREVGILHIFILTIVLLILCQLASHPPFYK